MLGQVCSWRSSWIASCSSPNEPRTCLSASERKVAPIGRQAIYQAQRIPVRWYNVRVPLFSWNDDKNQLLQEQREVGSSVLDKYVSDLEAAG